MAESKYDSFWKEALNKHGSIEEILDAARKNDKVSLAIDGIRKIGPRTNWYGKSIIGRKGKTGGDIMVHVAALKDILPPYIEEGEEFVCQMNGRGTTLDITWVG